MRAELALPLLYARMYELGYKDIEIHVRHVSVPRSQTRKINGGSDTWMLCDEQNIYHINANTFYPGTAVKIESENGVYDPLTEELEELEHEHTGEIILTNRSNQVQYVMFLQATPKIKENGTQNN